MRTAVSVHFNGATMEYKFDMDFKTFMKIWNNHLPAVGYFSNYDENGNFIVINPSQCGAIEFIEIGNTP